MLVWGWFKWCEIGPGRRGGGLGLSEPIGGTYTGYRGVGSWSRGGGGSGWYWSDPAGGGSGCGGATGSGLTGRFAGFS